MKPPYQNQQFTKVSNFFRDRLCCPICKNDLLEKKGLYCQGCLSSFPLVNGVFDFRMAFGHSMFNSQVINKWRKIQDRVENIYGTHFYDFHKEIEGVKEIYQDNFIIQGAVCDIGGHQGRLRHFLEDTSKYICIDPFIDVFEKIILTEGLTKAYPCLLEPCNFVAGFGEHLPFMAGIFDWVHIRSVLDHVYSPFTVIKESIRVLKSGGKILIGTFAIGGKSSLSDRKLQIIDRAKKKFRDEGISGLTKAVGNKINSTKRKLARVPIEEGHMKVWKYEELLSIIKYSGLQIEKIHWQKPPDDHCVYICATKP